MNEKISLKLFIIADTLVTYFHIDHIDNHYHIYIDVKSTTSCCPICASVKVVSNSVVYPPKQHPAKLPK